MGIKQNLKEQIQAKVLEDLADDHVEILIGVVQKMLSKSLDDLKAVSDEGSKTHLDLLDQIQKNMTSTNKTLQHISEIKQELVETKSKLREEAEQLSNIFSAFKKSASSAIRTSHIFKRWVVLFFVVLVVAQGWVIWSMLSMPSQSLMGCKANKTYGGLICRWLTVK